jgi:PAS domain S-box-containing protein
VTGQSRLVLSTAWTTPGSPLKLQGRRIVWRGEVPRRIGLGATKSSGQESQDRLGLAAIAETLSDPVFATALDGKIHSWNAAAEQLYGYSAEEIVGKPVSILAPPERAGEIEEILARWRRGETIKHFETVRRRKDGADVDVSLSITPVRSPSGDIVGASTVAHDISERKRREEVQSFLAEASRLLALNIDHCETLPTVASLTLRVADCCLVEMADATGSLTQVLDDQFALRRVATTVAEGATAIEQARAGGRYQKVRWWEKMVNVLWKRGDVADSMNLEDLFDQLAKKHELAIFCSFPRNRTWALLGTPEL